MRFGQWRGVTLAIALACGGAAAARADGWHAIPRETLAQDYRTGGVMMAPPIPYGCYAKDCVGTICGLPGSCLAKICGLCRGKGCGHCGGRGLCGHGGGDPCDTCGAGGGLCGKGGHGLFHRRCGYETCGTGGGLCSGGGGLFHHGGNSCLAQPSQQQPVVACPQGSGGLCGGKGHGRGLCGGGGLFHHGGKGCDDPCGACTHCGGKGCGHCGGRGLCNNCGGLGCGLCGGLCGKVHAAVGSLLHHGGVKYFVGPGGPVPLTPGYVNYVVPVRSPRDYFAFPPFVDIDP